MVDFTMFAGDTKVLQITLTDSANVIVDVSTASIIWALSRKATSTALLTKEVGTGVTITDGPGGKFEVAIDPVDTADLKGDYYHEIEVEMGGVVSTVTSGTITIQPDLIKT